MSHDLTEKNKALQRAESERRNNENQKEEETEICYEKGVALKCIIYGSDPQQNQPNSQNHSKPSRFIDAIAAFKAFTHPKKRSVGNHSAHSLTFGQSTVADLHWHRQLQSHTQLHHHHHHHHHHNETLD